MVTIDCSCIVCTAYLLGRQHGADDEVRARAKEVLARTRGMDRYGFGTPGVCVGCGEIPCTCEVPAP